MWVWVRVRVGSGSTHRKVLALVLVQALHGARREQRDRRRERGVQRHPEVGPERQLINFSYNCTILYFSFILGKTSKI